MKRSACQKFGNPVAPLGRKAFPLAFLAAFAVGSGQNLLQNPGFELGGDRCEAWTLSGWGTKASAVWTAGDGAGGGRAILLRSDDEKSRASAAQFIPVAPGKVYRIAGKVRAEGLDKDKAVVRATFLTSTRDPSGPNHLTVLKPDGEWRAFEDHFAVPSDKSFLRLDLFLLFGKGRVWYDDLVLEPGDPAKLAKAAPAAPSAPSASSNELAAALAASATSAGALRRETLALFEASRKGAPEPFQIVFAAVAARAKTFFQSPLRPVDMATVVGRPYGSYNMDVWRLRGVSEELHTLAMCLSIPGNELYGKGEALAKADEAFRFLAGHFSPEGSTRAPDANIDRFIMGPLLESFLLLEDRLKPETRRLAAELLVNAAYFQMRGFGRREGKGTYPNMDAAYLYLMQASGMLLGEKAFLAEAAVTLASLSNCMKGGTYEYIHGWNPDPRYTKVVLEFVGRYWQLSKNPEARRQIEAHRDYLVRFMEPGGVMDYGMSPFIKHDWTLQPFGAIGHALELVHGAAPHPVTQYQVDRLRKLGKTQAGLLASPYLLYWLSPDLGRREAPPARFLAESPEIEGFMMRTQSEQGTFTAYLTGKPISVDTRVSAIFTPASDPDHARAFAGLFLELMKDGASYYLGDMAPTLSRSAAPGALSLSIQQHRHTLGPNVECMPYGGHMNSIKNWKHDCWKGGSPDSPPVDTLESWTLDARSGFMRGQIRVVAEKELTLDEVRLRPFFLAKDLDEQRVDGPRLLLRAGGLCLEILSSEGAWRPRVTKTPFHFRLDLPNGRYQVTLTSGDEIFPTEPFDVSANDQLLAEPVRAERGAFAVRTFPVEVKEGALRLSFLPRSAQEHWKVNALVVEDRHKGYRRAFDVGSEFSPVAAGYERLQGKMAYSTARGFGWFRDLTAQERDRGTNAALTRDLITCPDGLETQVTFSDGAPRTWKTGEAYGARVTLGMSASLESFAKRL
ncbi:MAG: hypothetical protein J0L75_06130 [Spirochaetes bacterium]|nr:hypothetical protein [Spirochaetota bacterium]